MKILPILLIALALTSTYTTTVDEEENDPEAIAMIQEIDSSDYGKTLLNTIQIQLQSGDAVESLVTLLRDMEQDLVDEQTEDDQYIFDLQSGCDEELNRLEAEIKAAKQRVEELTVELGEKIPLRDQKQTSRDRKQNLLDLIREKQTDLDARKVLKDAEWQEEQEQHDIAESTILRAKQIIQEALTTSFLQKSSTTAFVQVSNSLSQVLKQYTFKRKGWISIFEILSQVTAFQDIQSDASAVQKIIEICDDLLDKIAESREIERVDYNHWIDEYQTTWDNLEAKAIQTEAEITELDSQIVKLTRRIIMAQQEKQEMQQRAEQKTLQHREREQWCDDENVAYGKRRELRTENRKVVSNAISLLMSKLRTLRKYIGNRRG